MGEGFRWSLFLLCRYERKYTAGERWEQKVDDKLAIAKLHLCPPTRGVNSRQAVVRAASALQPHAAAGCVGSKFGQVG